MGCLQHLGCCVAVKAVLADQFLYTREGQLSGNIITVPTPLLASPFATRRCQNEIPSAKLWDHFWRLVLVLRSSGISVRVCRAGNSGIL